MFSGFAVNTLLCVAQTRDLFVDAMLPKLCVTGGRPASTPFLNAVGIIPIMGLDTPTEFVSSLDWIKNSFTILIEQVIPVLLVHPPANRSEERRVGKECDR